jgi:hypothetical protein
MSEGPIITNVGAKPDPGSGSYPVLLRSQRDVETYYYNRYQAALAAPVRQAIWLRYGMPLGSFDPHVPYEQRNARLGQMVRELLAAGFDLDAGIFTPSTDSPRGLMVLRLAQAGPGVAAPLSLDPEALTPTFDMIATAKPFSWVTIPPESYLHGLTDDREGISTFYQSNTFGFGYDPGARWTDLATGRVYEKVSETTRYGSTQGWERIK